MEMHSVSLIALALIFSTSVLYNLQRHDGYICLRSTAFHFKTTVLCVRKDCTSPLSQQYQAAEEFRYIQGSCQAVLQNMDLQGIQYKVLTVISFFCGHFQIKDKGALGALSQ